MGVTFILIIIFILVVHFDWSLGPIKIGNKVYYTPSSEKAQNDIILVSGPTDVIEAIESIPHLDGWRIDAGSWSFGEGYTLHLSIGNEDLSFRNRKNLSDFFEDIEWAKTFKAQ